jgi:hypothetical protein
MFTEKRRYPRYPSHAAIHIESSCYSGTHKVILKDISKNGIFIRTTQMPRIGEVISFEILDNLGGEIATGKGQVIRLMPEAEDEDKGFGVTFHEELDDAQITRIVDL